jgi:hypothetical protein
VTRWADTFAALSRCADTLDTMRHSAAAAPTVSHNVNSVTAPPQSSAKPLDPGSATWGDAEEERAAIVKYDRGIPRTWAEGFARLHPDRAPNGVSPQRWGRFVDDIGGFLDGPFCSIAAALGWGPLDLFGCDRNRPLGRIDQVGLLWMLNGDKLVALSETTATIETQGGARQTFRRKPDEPGRALAWELRK